MFLNIRSERVRLRLLTAHLALLSMILLVCGSTALAAQQNFKIGKIEFDGLQRLSADDVIETSTLKIGQPFDVSVLDVAAQRLMDSGLFKNVAYRTHANRDQITITFLVEETKGGDSRVLFDNFIWFTDEELVAAVRRDVPSFSGTAPDLGNGTLAITHALQRLLQEHNIEGTVEYMASQDAPGSPVQEHVFNVTGINIPICTLHFPGATNVSEAELVENSKALLGNDYSRKFSTLFAINNLFPIYRELGQLGAAFAPPVAKPETSAKCRSGVDLTIPVAEGYVYKWDKANWSGISALTAQELDAVLGMKASLPANGVALDKGFVAVQKAYGRKGYLAVHLRSHPEFDDNAQKVSYIIDVREGPQYHMGKLLTKGLSESATKTLIQEWKLKPGDVFDQGYPIEFSQKQMGQILHSAFEERRAQGKPAPHIKSDLKMNRETLTVDVTYELTN
jgi:outer membrane protein assembly factor BamA